MNRVIKILVITILTLSSCSTTKELILHNHRGGYFHCTICNPNKLSYERADTIQLAANDLKNIFSSSVIVVSDKETHQNIIPEISISRKLTTSSKISNNSKIEKLSIYENRIINDHKKNKTGKGWAVSGLVIAALSIIFSFTIVVPLLLAPLGIIVSYKALTKTKKGEKPRKLAKIAFYFNLFITIICWGALFIIIAALS